MTLSHLVVGSLAFWLGFVIATLINVGAVECLYG